MLAFLIFFFTEDFFVRPPILALFFFFFLSFVPFQVPLYGGETHTHTLTHQGDKVSLQEAELILSGA